MKPQFRALAYVLVLALLVASFAYFTLEFARKVTGTSMYPTLEEGDMVVVLNVPFSSIQVGDVVVYDPPCAATGESVIHRVVAVDPGGFVTKGDNNLATDQVAGIAVSPVSSACLEGKVVFVVPYLEKLAFLPYNANYLLAVLILTLILLSEFYGRGKEKQLQRPSA